VVPDRVVVLDLTGADLGVPPDGPASGAAAIEECVVYVEQE